MRHFVWVALVPACMFAASCLRLGLWVLGWAVALAVPMAWALASGGEVSAWWRGLLFAFA